MYIYFSEPLEFQIETPVQSDGTVKKLLNEKLPNGTTLISATKTLTTISLESKGNEESKDTKKWNKVVSTHCYHHLNNMAMLFTMQMEII